MTMEDYSEISNYNRVPAGYLVYIYMHTSLTILVSHYWYLKVANHYNAH